MRDNGSNSAGMPAVVAENLQKRYGNFVAVDGVALQVAPGEIFGFLGPNGAGKSTTIAMLTTILRPSGGKAFVEGFDVERNAKEVRMTSGVALQEIGMDDMMTAQEVLTLQGRIFGMSSKQAGRRADELLDLVDLRDVANKRVGKYSGGMRRRLDLAVALVHRPSILFLDEPTTGLDPASRRTVWNEIRRLNSEAGMTIFLTTQYLEEADSLGDRIAIIDHGKIVAEGRPAELKAELGTSSIVFRFDRHGMVQKAVDHFRAHGMDPKTEKLELRLYTADAASKVPSIVAELDRAGIEISSLTLAEPSLDDVFLQVTGALYTEEPAKESA